jgi:GNAT superfamily N-acetyltransferase
MSTQVLATMNTQKGLIRIIKQSISAHDYIEFLTRSDLGSQYPKERFVERIEKLVHNVQISILAINEAETVVGICFGLTDFAYWLMITDLAMDREYTRNGIGSKMISLAREIAGGEKDIIVFINANDDAISFYEKNGLTRAAGVMELGNVEWTDFVVSKADIPIA